MTKLWQSKITPWILLGLIILSSLLFIFHQYSLKDNYHIDEQWSYAHSNSATGPYLTLNDDRYYRWFSPEEYHNYLTVQPQDRFEYGHIYNNLRKDMHTPLYFIILHTICSFFPDTFNQWLGGGLNMFLWVLTLLAMYRLSRQFFDNPYVALAPIFLYAFSLIGISTAVYIRLYMLQTLLATCLFNEIILFMRNEQKIVRHSFLIFLYSLLNMLTSYNSIILSFFISVVFGTYLLIKRRIRPLIYLAIAMTGSLIVFLNLFPPAINTLFLYNPQYYNNGIDFLEIILSVYYTELFNVNLIMTYNIIYTYLFALLTIYTFSLYVITAKKLNPIFMMLFFITALIFFYMSYSLPDMFVFRSRYYMCVAPLLSILTIYMLYKIFVGFAGENKAKYLLGILLIINIGFVNYERYCPYFMRLNKSDKQIIKQLEGKKLVVISNTSLNFDSAAYIYPRADKLFFAAGPFYLHTFSCALPESVKDRQQKIYEQINQGDYLLIFNTHNSQFKFDATIPVANQANICNKFHGLEFINTAQIGNLFYDVYKINDFRFEEEAEEEENKDN